MSDSGETLGELGEEALVARLVARLKTGVGVVVGAGDDCAVVETEGDSWELLKTDCLVEDVHFAAGADPVRVGRKAMNRALSDIAAMAGEPAHALVTLASHAERPAAEVEGWNEGLCRAAEEAGCAVVGGETTGLARPGGVISVALTGRVAPDRCVRRSGAAPGDVIAVTGRLGGSFESGRHLDFVPRLAEARWLAAHHRPNALMDLSDGLGSDLPRLATASGVGFRIEPDSLPRHPDATAEQAIRDGEDYELLFTLAADRWEASSRDWAAAFPELPLTAIGEITEETGGVLERGWEHYRPTT